jgi:segregation and condensation protein A
MDVTGRAVEDSADPPDEESGEGGIRFPVEVPGFTGPLEELLLRAHRGEIDLATVPVAEITDSFRRRLADGPIEARDVADFIDQASRLVALKAQRLLPEGDLEAQLETGDESGAVDDPGARLAEYRLFRAAADALLAEAAEQGLRSFLGLVAAEVVPSERLSIAPERLAEAFRRVLARLPEQEPLGVDTVTFSVDEKVAELRELLSARRRVPFEDLFLRARSRLEAVACFLALLELVKSGEARVDQEQAFAGITVSAIGAAS